MARVMLLRTELFFLTTSLLVRNKVLLTPTRQRPIFCLPQYKHCAIVYRQERFLCSLSRLKRLAYFDRRFYVCLCHNTGISPS
jgi:hypothetical protein